MIDLTKKTTLYALSQEWLDVQNRTDEINSQDDADEWTATLDRLQGSIQDKVLAIARVVKNMQAQADGIKAERQRLEARERSVTNAIARLKEYAQVHMDKAGVARAEDDLFTVAIQNNPPRVDVHDPDAVPATFWTTPDPVLDKRGIMDRLKAGEDVPGASLLQSQGLRIR